MQKFLKVIKTIGYWFVSCTWGIIITLLGLLVSLGMLISGHKPHKFGYGFYFEFGEGWGGLELGPVFIVSKDAAEVTKQHEAGHGYQNLWFGPFMPLLISIPSAIRYWHRRSFKTQTKKYRFVERVCYPIMFIGASLIALDYFLVLGFLVYIGIGLFVYGSALWIWLNEIELPRYINESPEYDAIWFEKNASYIGKKFIPSTTKPIKEIQEN